MQQTNAAEKRGRIKIQECNISEARRAKRNFSLTPFICGATHKRIKPP
jgi:hypothetical protein